jgi:hypothetical protein
MSGRVPVANETSSDARLLPRHAHGDAGDPWLPRILPDRQSHYLELLAAGPRAAESVDDGVGRGSNGVMRDQETRALA